MEGKCAAVYKTQERTESKENLRLQISKKVNLERRERERARERESLVALKDVLSEIYQARKLRQHSSRIRSDSLIWFNNVRNFGDETWISNHFPRQKLQPEYSAKFVRTILTAFLSQFQSLALRLPNSVLSHVRSHEEKEHTTKS